MPEELPVFWIPSLVRSNPARRSTSALWAVGVQSRTVYLSIKGIVTKTYRYVYGKTLLELLIPVVERSTLFDMTTTPWDRIGDDEDYKNWLLEAMTPEEYDAEPPMNRRTLRTQFQQQQQQSVGRQQEDVLRVLKRDAEQLVESMVIKHRIIESKGRPMRTLSYVSKSHAFSSLTVQNRITFAHDFFFDLVDPLERTADAFREIGPDASEDEIKVHHPYFLREMEKLVNSASSEGWNIRQQLFWTKSGHWLKLDDGISAGVEPDFCTTDTISGGALVASSDKIKLPQSKYDVSIAFEQKKQFVEADQMEMVDYGERLLCIQRGRPVAYTALFHCTLSDKTIRWAETTEVDGQFVTKVSKPASLCPGHDGQRQLLTMLTKSSSELGRDFPKLDQPVEGQYLHVLYNVGEGATSNVYAARLGGVDGVVKVMKIPFRHIADHEKRILDHLRESGAAGVPNCAKVSEDVLFIEPLLRPFTGTFSVEKVAAIVDCLETVHSAGVLHRDIRPENFLEDATGNLILIDWGFALFARNCGPQHFAGTFRYGSEASVRAAQTSMEYQYSPEDDLESLVKTVVAVNSGERRILRKTSAIQPGDFGAALQLWTEECHLFPVFQEMFAAARAQDYAKLKRCLVY